MKNIVIILLALMFLQLCIGTFNAQATFYYNDESGATLVQDTGAVAYNLTAIAQSDSNGYGPTYFIQGLTDTGYLYQEGLTYQATNSKFLFVYSVFNPSGYRIINSSFSGVDIGKVNPNDKILLDILFGNGNNNIYLYIRDYNTGANYVLNYSSGGATKFVGNPNSISNQNHFFTGLVTNWYHLSKNQPSQTVMYSPVYDTHSSARLWMFSLEDILLGPSSGTGKILANFTSPLVSYSSQSAFQLNNLGVSYYRGVFSTGPVHLVPLSISRSQLLNMTVDSNGPCNINASVSINGGKSPYTYLLYIDNSSLVTSKTNNPNSTMTLNCGGIFAGQHNYYIKIIDSNGNITTTPKSSLKVNPAIQILSSLAITQNSFFFNNDTEKVSASVIGGTPPYKYNWYTNNELVLNLNGPNQSIHLNNGQNRVNLLLQDGAGANLSGITIDVSTNYNYPHILLVILIILIILALLILRWYLYNRDEYYHVDKNNFEKIDEDGSSSKLMDEKTFEAGEVDPERKTDSESEEYTNDSTEEQKVEDADKASEAEIQTSKSEAIEEDEAMGIETEEKLSESDKTELSSDKNAGEDLDSSEANLTENQIDAPDDGDEPISSNAETLMPKKKRSNKKFTTRTSKKNKPTE